MTKAERTKQLIIEQTAPVFNRKGFAGTSLNDLTTVTGYTKGALYGHFENKESLANEAFRFAMKKVKQLVAEKLKGSETSREKLTALLEFYSLYVFNPPVAGGCPLVNAAVEVDDEHISMRPVVTAEVMGTISFIRSLLEDGIRNGEFLHSARPRELAYTFFCMIEGAIIFSRLEQSREPMDIVIKHCKNLLDQISINHVNE